MNKFIALLGALLLCIGISAQNHKAIVVYFSASGTTASVAKQLATEAKAEIYAITPAKTYTDADLDWQNNKSRSSLEMNDKKSRPTLNESKNLSAYEIIYLGYPIWWGVAPRIINTFIEQAKLEGKTVIPFATSGGSGIERSVKELKSSYPKINWQSGKLLNSPSKAELNMIIKK